MTLNRRKAARVRKCKQVDERATLSTYNTSPHYPSLSSISTCLLFSEFSPACLKKCLQPEPNQTWHVDPLAYSNRLVPCHSNTSFILRTLPDGHFLISLLRLGLVVLGRPSSLIIRLHCAYFIQRPWRHPISRQTRRSCLATQWRGARHPARLPKVRFSHTKHGTTCQAHASICIVCTSPLILSLARMQLPLCLSAAGRHTPRLHISSLVVR
jgi:hypothetical protein